MQSKTVLKKLCLLALEIGYKQYFNVSQILKKNSFKEELIIKDYKRNVRSIIAKLQN